MNRKDLDTWNDLYLSVYGEEQLDEGWVDTPKGRRFVTSTGEVRTGDPNAPLAGAARAVKRFFTQPRLTPAQMRASTSGVPSSTPTEKPQQPITTPTKMMGPEIPKRILQSPRPTELPPPSTKPTETSRQSSAVAPRPAPSKPSGPVLSKKNGVEGTGVGKDFKKRAFTDAEKSRYTSVAAQNAAKSATSTRTPKLAPSSSSSSSTSSAPTPAVGKLGNTSFERRTPTSAELRAAQTARAGGASPEKALQSAQKTNLSTTGPTPAIPDLKSVNADLAKANSPAVINRPAPAGSALAKQQAQQKLKPPTMQNQSYEWPSEKEIGNIASAYASIYEAKKKVDQDEDGDNDFADVRIARMIASGVPKAKAIAMVKNKSYNEDIEYIEERDEGKPGLMFKKIAKKAAAKYGSVEAGNRVAGAIRKKVLANEATRMGKELGKEGEIATRKELAARSNAYQRSGSVDKTIAAAERRADRPYVKPLRGENESDYNKRLQKSSDTMSKLAASRRGSVRDKPRAGLRGYAADVKGSDKELQNARSSARVAGTLTPREKKQLNNEAYAAYEVVASYLLENNFATTVKDADVIIKNMSENWFKSIIEG